MCAFREDIGEISVVMLVGADVVCIDDDISIAEVKLRNAENKEDTSNGPESCDVSEDEEEEKEEHYESPKLLTKKDLKPGES